MKMVHDVVHELEKINKNETDKELCEVKGAHISDNKESPFRRQAIISLGVFMQTTSAGSTSGISAIMIPQLKLARSDITTEMVSWIASISSLALFFGNIMSGYLMERFGRRRSILIVASGFVFGWIIITFSNDLLYLLLIGRFITGLCVGWLGPLGSVFVGEISTPIYRGLFLTALSLGIAVGVFLAHLFGTFFHWTVASLLCGLFPLMGGIIVFYAPESPSWLASANRIDESVISFQWYRGKSLAMKTELENMLNDLKNKNKNPSKLQALSANIRKPEFYKPLCIMTVFFIICQLSGVNVVSAYATGMMAELMGTSSNSYTVMLVIDILRCVSLGSACYLLKTSGRRPMALFSGVFTSLSLISLAIYLYFYHVGIIGYVSPVISLGLMAFYIVASNMGVTVLPWNMVGELFAVETKGIGSGISVMMTSITFFGVVKSAPAMFISIGYHGAYLFYGLSTLCGTIFLYFFLPETKNKTLLQIEEHFRSGRNRETCTVI